MARWTRSTNRLVWCLVLLVGALALAQTKSAKKPDAEEVKARALFKDGQTAYDVGEFKRALDLYTDAYKLKPLPGFLFNIAQCHRQLNDFKLAAFFFGRFIDNSKPEAANVELARELLADMTRRQDEVDKAAAAAAAEEKPKTDVPLATSVDLKTPMLEPVLPPPPPPPIEETPVTKKGWFWGVLGGAAVVVAGGIVAGVLLSQPKTVPYVPTMTTLPDIDARSMR
jgi:hypothetical protein